MKDIIENRMKTYEQTTKLFLPRRSNTIIRIDGKAFHSYTRDLESPFDRGFIDDMNSTAIYLCENIQGAKFAYVQSDEISILLNDFENINTDAWFGNNLQKICSVSASLATAKFNELRTIRASTDPIIKGHGLSFSEWIPSKLAHFDSRVFQIPQEVEVNNYFLWRQRDCYRNAIQSIAQSVYSHKELHGVTTNELIFKLLDEKDIDINSFDNVKLFGRTIKKESFMKGDAVRTRWSVCFKKF